MPRTAGVVAAALLLAGCTSAAAQAPDWRPQPSFQGEGGGPRVSAPVPRPPQPPDTSSRPHSPSPSPSSTEQRDPAVVATKLRAPVGLTLLPDGTALVGERTTGRIVRVQPSPGKPVTTVRTLPGLDTAGDGGLLDLALSPHYLQDSLIFAYITTATDNRVVVFTLHGAITPVLAGIPKGATGNGGRIAFDRAGDLFVATGDAGDPALAVDPTSLAGKVLRVDDIGRPVAGNPSPSSPVFTTGNVGTDGLCIDGRSGAVLSVTADRQVDVLRVGQRYDRPAPAPLTTLPTADTAPGDCAVSDGTLYVTTRDGESLLSTRLDAGRGGLSAGKFHATLKHKYGRLRTVVAAPDGALWLTTSNRDGHGSPVPDDERVLRIVPSGGGGKDKPL